MTQETLNHQAQKGSAKRRSLYQEFLAEREEILKHKWIESEKAGHDIGFERALLNWVCQHRDSWRKTRRRKIRASGASDGAPPAEST